MKKININKTKIGNACDVENVMEECFNLESESYGIVSLLTRI